MSEWPNEHAWKACVPQGTEGSNPSLSAILTRTAFLGCSGKDFWKDGLDPRKRVRQIGRKADLDALQRARRVTGQDGPESIPLSPPGNKKGPVFRLFFIA